MMSQEMPDRVELCQQLREGLPCLGVIYRGQPDMPYCFRCGEREDGVVYIKGQLAFFS